MQHCMRVNYTVGMFVELSPAFTEILFFDILGGAVKTENGEVVTLGKVLTFFTGADKPPPLGFPKQPTLRFSEETLAVTGTCDPDMSLPVHCTYETFKYYMTLSVIGSKDNFGIV